MAKKYELVLILDPQVGDTQLESVVDNYKTRLESAGAEIVNVEPWGLRKLAYTSMALRQRQQAFYVLFQFQGDNELFGALEPELKLDESVLRHLFVAVQGEFLRVPQLAPENVYIYHPPDRTRDRRGPRRDRRDDGGCLCIQRQRCGQAQLQAPHHVVAAAGGDVTATAIGHRLRS